jgi:hypothetical protein
MFSICLHEWYMEVHILSVTTDTKQTTAPHSSAMWVYNSEKLPPLYFPIDISIPTYSTPLTTQFKWQ